MGIKEWCVKILDECVANGKYLPYVFMDCTWIYFFNDVHETQLNSIEEKDITADKEQHGN